MSELIPFSDNSGLTPRRQQRAFGRELGSIVARGEVTRYQAEVDKRLTEADINDVAEVYSEWRSVVKEDEMLAGLTAPMVEAYARGKARAVRARSLGF